MARDGRVRAVVVSEAAPFDQALYALPFSTSGLRDGNEYVANVDRDEFRWLRPFDYKRLGIPVYERPIGATSASREAIAAGRSDAEARPAQERRRDSR